MFKVKSNFEKYIKCNQCLKLDSLYHYTYYGHHLRMNQQNLTRKILTHFEAIKVIPRRLTEAHMDMKKNLSRVSLRKQERNLQTRSFQKNENQNERKNKTKITVLPKDKMNGYWRNTKANRGKKMNMKTVHWSSYAMFNGDQ